MRLRNSITAGALAVALLAATVCQAQVPQKMNYQVMLTDDADQPLADQSVQLVFRIYNVESGGGSLWTETHNVNTNSIGVVSVVLGTTNPISIDMSGPRWLQVEVDGEILSPRREIVASAYAIHDESGGAGDGHSLDADDGSPVDAVYVDSEGKVGIGTTTPWNPLHVQGSARIQDYGLGVTALWIAAGDPFHNGVSLYSYDAGGGYLEVSHDNGLPAAGMGTVSYAGGGGFLNLMRNDAGNPAFTMTGNHVGSGEPRMAIMGTTSDVVFDLSESQSARVQLPAGAIDAGEIWNECGVGSGQSSTPITLTGGGFYNEINNRSLYAPGGGYVFVLATANATAQHSGTLESSASFGISRLPNAFSDNAQETRLYLPANCPAGRYDMSLAVSALFEVPNGTWSFYFVGLEDYGDWEVSGRQITAMFIPSSYGTIDTVDGPVLAGSDGQDGIAGVAGAGSSGQLPEHLASGDVATQNELDALRARVLELERMMSEETR